MSENTGVKKHIKTGCVSIMTGLAVYFILTAAFVAVMWFTSISEAWMTYAAGICLGAGCFASGFKMGGSVHKKGLVLGLAAGVLMSLILWLAAELILGINALDSPSFVKIGSGVICGAFGGIIGVNK